eukprot:8349654-Pyramimonas_sp.AAC.1
MEWVLGELEESEESLKSTRYELTDAQNQTRALQELIVTITEERIRAVHVARLQKCAARKAIDDSLKIAQAAQLAKTVEMKAELERDLVEVIQHELQLVEAHATVPPMRERKEVSISTDDGHWMMALDPEALVTMDTPLENTASRVPSTSQASIDSENQFPGSITSVGSPPSSSQVRPYPSVREGPCVTTSATPFLSLLPRVDANRDDCVGLREALRRCIWTMHPA